MTELPSFGGMVDEDVVAGPGDWGKPDLLVLLNPLGKNQDRRSVVFRQAFSELLTDLAQRRKYKLMGYADEGSMGLFANVHFSARIPPNSLLSLASGICSTASAGHWPGAPRSHYQQVTDRT
ncbi:Fc.00g090700.m01.CDS01 [Cosmosporella sp. VM-42]